MDFNAAPPKPYSSSWREAYRYTDKDAPRLSSYQAPGGQPVTFTYKSIRLSAGQSVDTAEFPFWGFWSNTPLNEKPQQITVTGFVSGENYITKRNELFAAVQVRTSDDSCGYLDMPLWGRFPVVVTQWDIEEANSANGKADFSLTFTRAGYSEDSRVESNGASAAAGDISSAKDKLNTAAVKSFASNLSEKTDTDTLVSGFTQLKQVLTDIVGRVQGAKSALNNMMSKVNSITNLIAQGVRTPAILAQALVSAAVEIVAGILEIASAIDSTKAYFSREDAENDDSVSEQFVKNNVKNVLMNFLNADKFALEEDAVTENQQATKAAVENLYKTIAFAVCAQLLPELDSATYQSQSGIWTLFERLENSLNMEDADVYNGVTDTRIAAAQSLLAQNASVEMTKEIYRETPLLALALYLGCDGEKIRKLNSIADSFLIKGNVIYV